MPGAEAERIEEVYDHLGQVINRVIAEGPQDAYGFVEVLSRLVKEAGGAKLISPTPTQKEDDARAEHAEKVKALDKAPCDEENAPIQVCAVPDFMEDAEMIAWAGAGFSKTESYSIACSMRNLAGKLKESAPDCRRLRFWGKVLGTEKDYYVVEAAPALDPPGGPPDDPPEGMEIKTGVNAMTFFVTNDLCGDWDQLPDLVPQDIVDARLIKKIMTGNLEAKVTSHPYFAGAEAVLLRAQIAQITADTVLCMKGYLHLEDPEDPGTVAENPEFVHPLPAELLSKENWIHMHPHILKNGLTQHKPIDEADGENDAEVERQKAEQAADPSLPVLRDLTEDKLEWAVKQAGDTALYRNPFKPADPEAPPPPPLSYATTYVRSLTWPGAVSVAQGRQFANFYVGYGIPKIVTDFFFRAPEDVQDEPEDAIEGEEPQGPEEVEEEPKDDDE